VVELFGRKDLKTQHWGQEYGDGARTLLGGTFGLRTKGLNQFLVVDPGDKEGG